MKSNQEQARQYYDEHLRDFGFSPKGMGWRDETAQRRRFEQVIRLIEAENFSINDLGCGSGDLFTFLLKNFNLFTYRGYDVHEKMIRYATDKFVSASNARFELIQSPEEMEISDYTVACGIFSLKYETGEDKWLEYVLSTVKIMFDRSRRGVAFNLLTNYADPEKMEDYLYYGDPLYLFDYCKKNFSMDVALLHDYDEFDFTILVRK